MALPEVITSPQQIHDHLFPNLLHQKVWITCLEDINRRNEPTQLSDLISRALDTIVIINNLKLGDEIDFTADTFARYRELKEWCDDRMPSYEDTK